MKSRIILISVVLMFFVMACSSKKTCEICGYIALSGDRCEYCGNKVWDESFGMEQKEYTKLKQLDWFYIAGETPDFLGPIEAEDVMNKKLYKKDAKWLPTVTVEEVTSHQP